MALIIQFGVYDVANGKYTANAYRVIFAGNNYVKRSYLFLFCVIMHYPAGISNTFDCLKDDL